MRKYDFLSKISFKGLLIMIFSLLFINNYSVAERIDFLQIDPDSLQLAIDNADNLMDKADMLVLMASYLLNVHNDLEKATIYANKVLEIGNRLKSNYYLGHANNVLGSIYHKRSNFDYAEDHFMNALNYFNRDKKKYELSMVYLNLGNLAQDLGKTQLALFYYEKSLELKKEVNDEVGLGTLYMNMGNLKYHRGEYDKSLGLYLNALKVFEEIDDKTRIARMYNNIGNVYFSTKKYNNAIDFYEKSLTIREQINDLRGISIVLNNIGSVLYSAMSYDSALVYFNRSLELKHKFGDNYASIAGTIGNIAGIYRILEDYQKAEKYYLEAVHLREKYGSRIEVATVYYNMSEFLFEVNRKDEALSYLKKSKELAEEHEIHRIKIASYRRLAKYYEDNGNFKKALEYKRKYIDEKEKEFSESYKKSLEAIERYQMEEQEKINELLMKETEIQALAIERDRIVRISIIIVSTAVLLILGLLLIVLYRKMCKEKKLNNQLASLKADIQRSRDRFQKILSGTSDFIYSITFKPGEKLHDSFFSPAIEKITGVKPEELSDDIDIWKELIVPKDKKAVELLSGKIVEEASGEEYVMEFRIRNKNGQICWLHQKVKCFIEHDGFYRIDGVVRDITKRKEAEASLKESEYLYRSTIDSLTDHNIHVIDTDYRIIVFNKAFQRLNNKLGLTTDVIGEYLYNVYHFLNNGVRSDYSKVFSDAEVVVSTDEMMVNGERVFTETYKIPVINNDKVEKVITIMKDISADVKAREALEKSEEMYRKASVSKDKFFSVIAHDLISPFSALLGFSGLLNDMYDDYTEEERKRQVAKIMELSEFIYKMAENLLLWSRTQTGRIELEPETLNINKLVSDQIDIFQPISEKKNIDLLYEVNEKIEFVSDPNMLSVILRNLIANALKFTAHRGKVSVLVNEEDDAVVIKVVDNGIGMSKEMIKTLWTPGGVVKRQGTDREIGTGLGLMITKEFVEKLNGSIKADSVLSEGTTFTLRIPLSLEKVEAET